MVAAAKGTLPETKMKPGIATTGTDAKPMASAKGGVKPKGYASGGRLSPLADVSSKNPLAYGAK